MFTSYLPVVPKHRQSDPWPAPTYEQVMARGRALFAYYNQPPRPFPVARFYTARQAPGKNYCRLADIPYEAVLQNSPIYQRAPKLPIRTPDPRGRLLRLVHRQLDKIIAWLAGWRRVDRQLLTSGKSHPTFP